MKRMFKLSVAICTLALAFGVSLTSVAAETPCDECYRAYERCMKESNQILCYGALSRCLKNSTGCQPPN
ncbi:MULTISPECIES: hypothetical protein [unclassified Stenotrophomonas maltophilia group]|uniref:hypothetical protein n=1 Tax=unclassified Stenotrophomonas maltophilia group TaxID=2961925 RepID=UPI00131F25AB|nr:MULTISPECIES: hypothetical protein [unclassified Stenotrophomonas maltophilia group]